MAEAYKKAKLITTAGSSSGFVGFQNSGSAAQNVTIKGPFIYGATAGYTGQIVTFNVAAGAIVPLVCAEITPQTNPVLGFMA